MHGELQGVETPGSGRWGVSAYVVLLGKLAIDIEHALAKGHEIIERVGGAAIDRNVPADACGESSFEVEVGPVHVDGIFADLGDNSLEFSMVFEDGTGALCHILNREAVMDDSPDKFACATLSCGATSQWGTMPQLDTASTCGPTSQEPGTTARGKGKGKGNQGQGAVRCT